jgi:hypothetical protein
MYIFSFVGFIYTVWAFYRGIKAFFSWLIYGTPFIDVTRITLEVERQLSETEDKED